MFAPMTTDAEPPTGSAAAALLAIHRVLHPEAHHDGADPIKWTADTLDQVDELVAEAVEGLGLVERL